VAERFCATHPNLSTRVSVGEAPDTVNPKVALLERMSRQTNGDWLVVSDSNVRVAPGYVTEALSHATPEVGLITHLVSGVGGDSAAAHCENLHLNTFIAPAICGARFLASRTCVVGKSMFLRRDVLDQLGGFRSAGDFLAEDYALGQAVERAGYRVATSSVPVSAWHEGWTFKRFFNRHVRWAVMRRRISVLGYLAELLVSPGPVLNLLLLVGWVAQVSPGTLGWVTTGLVLEALMAWVTYWRISGRCMSWQALLCKPLRDGLALGIWILGWFVQRIEWRAKTYRIGAQTVLQAAPVTLAEGIIDEPYH
jgi:ceramide glucosyltransferase